MNLSQRSSCYKHDIRIETPPYACMSVVYIFNKLCILISYIDLLTGKLTSTNVKSGKCSSENVLRRWRTWTLNGFLSPSWTSSRCELVIDYTLSLCQLLWRVQRQRDFRFQHLIQLLNDSQYDRNEVSFYILLASNHSNIKSNTT